MPHKNRRKTRQSIQSPKIKNQDSQEGKDKLKTEAEAPSSEPRLEKEKSLTNEPGHPLNEYGHPLVKKPKTSMMKEELSVQKQDPPVLEEESKTNLEKAKIKNNELELNLQKVKKRRRKHFGKTTVFLLLRLIATFLLFVTGGLIVLGPGMRCRTSTPLQIGFTEYCNRNLMYSAWSAPLSITLPDSNNTMKSVQVIGDNELGVYDGQMASLVLTNLCFLGSCFLVVAHSPLCVYYGRFWHVFAVINGITALLMAIIGGIQIYYASCGPFSILLEDSILHAMSVSVRTAQFQCIVAGWAFAAGFAITAFLFYAAIAILHLAWLRQDFLLNVKQNKLSKSLRSKKEDGNLSKSSASSSQPSKSSATSKSLVNFGGSSDPNKSTDESSKTIADPTQGLVQGSMSSVGSTQPTQAVSSLESHSPNAQVPP